MAPKWVATARSLRRSRVYLCTPVPVAACPPTPCQLFSGLDRLAVHDALKSPDGGRPGSQHQPAKISQNIRNDVIAKNSANSRLSSCGDTAWAIRAPTGAKAIVVGTINAKPIRLT